MKKLYILFVLLTALAPLRSVLLGGIPFWHDPGRDFLLAWNNLSKPTLIGPPGGIPGIFYGPYWVWLLSLPMIITRDPKLVTLLAITIPSLVLIPLIFWKLRNYFGLPVVFILWTLFITNYESFVTYPWSPYPVALVFLLLSYLIIRRKSPFLIGLAAALAPNFNFSFGVTVVVATAIWQLLTDWRRFPKFLLGLAVVYLPQLLFELRHGFFQARTFWEAFSKSAFYNTPVVGQTGMAKTEILPQLATIAAGLLHVPKHLYWLPGLVFPIFFVAKRLFKDRFILFLGCCLASLLATYFLTKNPVWPYYFLGTEMVFLLLLGRLLSVSKILTGIVAFLAAVFFLSSLATFIRSLRPDYLLLPTLASKESIARFVAADAKGEPVAVFAYSPAIYSYDYDYLFRWLSVRKNPDSRTAYLIIPPTSAAIFKDFINYKTPETMYRTAWTKIVPDGTTIIRREKP